MKTAYTLLVLLFFAAVVFAQTSTIKGKITNEKGQALPGVNVKLKNTAIATISDAAGTYQFANVKGAKATLVFALSNYANREVTVILSGTEKVLNVKMKSATAQVQTDSVSVSLQNKADERQKATATATGKANAKMRGKKEFSAPSSVGLTYTWTGNANFGSSNNIGYSSGTYAVTTPYNNSTNFASGDQEFNTEEYASLTENNFKNVKDSPVSTFSSDVDKASYSNIRRFIMQGTKPPQDAVRVEEMINYFKYDYPEPKDKHPFSITTEVSDCPWDKAHRLVHIGLKGKDIEVNDRPKSNLVFLVDVSGSMDEPNKLPLVKSSMRLLVGTLTADDRVSIVVYAGSAGLVLPPTSGDRKDKIMDALEQLQAGGSTAGGQGIQLAYNTAREHFVKDGNNRVILATDGDFNVGVSSDGELTRLIEKERESCVFLTVLGFGMGNYKDSKMKQLADKGNGNYAYIDNLMEAQKVMVKEVGSTLYTIAKDVKIQVEFNPTLVQSYRLIEYESRILQTEDFNNDKKDAGEIGAGHTVTALYEIVPTNGNTKTLDTPNSDPLKYQVVEASDKAKNSSELLTVKFRYKLPKEDESKLITVPLKDEFVSIEKATDNFRFSAAVAQFGLLLRDSKFKGNSNYASIISLASNAKGKDESGYRNEFVKLAQLAQNIEPYKASK